MKKLFVVFMALLTVCCLAGCNETAKGIVWNVPDDSEKMEAVVVNLAADASKIFNSEIAVKRIDGEYSSSPVADFGEPVRITKRFNNGFVVETLCNGEIHYIEFTQDYNEEYGPIYKVASVALYQG